MGELDVLDKTVLELGCGPGLVALAARQAGARAVLATDRSVLNLHLVSASAQLNKASGRCAAELFDILQDLPIPCGSGCLCGNARIGPYGSSIAWLPDCFDFVTMAEVLHDGCRSCGAFG